MVESHFFHLIDLAVFNSYILFPEQQEANPNFVQLQCLQRYNLENFREELIRNICDLPLTDQPPAHARVHPQPPAAGVFVVEHCLIFVEAKKQCVVCAKNEESGRNRVKTTCSAPECRGKHMHLTSDKNCWWVFHSREFHNT